MNCMDKVADLRGLQLFEKFNLVPADYCKRSYVARLSLNKEKISNPYYFTDEGLIK